MGAIRNAYRVPALLFFFPDVNCPGDGGAIIGDLISLSGMTCEPLFWSANYVQSVGCPTVNIDGIPVPCGTGGVYAAGTTFTLTE